MKNLILTMCLLLVVSFTYAQLHVVKEKKEGDNIITPNGAVGIGFNEPTEMLDVAGNGNFRGQFLKVGYKINQRAAKIQIGSGRTSHGNAVLDLFSAPDQSGGTCQLTASKEGNSTFVHNGKGESYFALKTQFATPIRFKTNNTTKMILLPNGNVGIGTISDPIAKLEVNGTAKKTGGGEFVTTSDKRTKKNINQYEAGLADVLKLNPVTFNYNGKAGITDTEKNHVGLIAQEFAEVAPYAVEKFDFTEEGSNKTEEYMSIDASSVKYMLVNAVKEQQALIEAQKAKIESLEEKMEKMATNGASISTAGASEMSVLLEGSGTESALLAQNSPNPFTTNTRIEYFIPSDSRHCRMSFRDMNGKELKEVQIENDGIGAIDLSAKDLAAGIYSYVLYVNGEIVASKKMILRQ